MGNEAMTALMPGANKAANEVEIHIVLGLSSVLKFGVHAFKALES
jgi:hypothetical protein